MNISKSFEIFWSIPKKLFGKKFFKVQHVETEVKTGAGNITADVSEKDICINVYNSPKVYNLLASVLYKKKILNENKNGKIYQECYFN